MKDTPMEGLIQGLHIFGAQQKLHSQSYERGDIPKGIPWINDFVF